MKKVNSYGYGDHYIHLKVKIPRSLNAKQRALLQAYAEIEDDTPGVIHGVMQQKDGKQIFHLTLNFFFFYEPFFKLIYRAFFQYFYASCGHSFLFHNCGLTF